MVARLLGLGVSAAALSVSSHAVAQIATPPAADPQAGASSRSTDPTTPPDDAAVDIVVTGIRSSIATAQNIKRNADTVVDAISAEDIGALPDRSVTEALQRVPGVSISRFAGATDPDHFSAEGSGIVIRGLNYVRSEFNGRDSFSTNGGRGLNFADVSPELLGSVEVYKNMTADQIEGGIAGTVNLNTRKPFDSKVPVLYISADMNYSDLANRGGPAVSALYSRNFNTGIGRFGVLVGGSYSQLFTRSDGIQVTNFQQRFNGSRDVNGDGIAETDTFPGLAPGQVAYAPVGAGIRTEEFNRERIGAAAALQYQTNDESLLATLQFVRTDARETWGEHTMETNPDAVDRATFPAAGTNYAFDADGVFRSGTITYDRGYTPPGGEQFGMETQLSNRGVKTRAVTDDFGGNIRWKATDRLSFNFDGQYVHSTDEQTDFSVFGSTFANVDLDLSGATPKVEFLRPSGTGSNAAYFADPANSFYRAAMDHFEQNEGHEWAFRGDATYDVGDGFFKKVKVGARYADRDQTVRYSLYNWGALSEVWAGSGPVHFSDTSPANYGLYSFDNLFRGSGTAANANYINGNPATNYAAIAAQAQAINAQWVAMGGQPGFIPAGQRPGVVPGTNFLPSEIYGNSETTEAAYARLDFGTQGGSFLGGVNLSGNIGLRYVRTIDKANGFFTLPTNQQLIGGSASAAVFCADPMQTSPFCALTATQQASLLTFSNGASTNQSTRNGFDHWLPSFNLKVGLTPKLLTRFAYSKAISRPDFGQLQSTIQVQPAFGITPFRLDGGSRNSNPNLRPVEANQFDLTLEWYFAKVGSLTGALFYKDLTNVIVSDVTQSRAVTNNGVTQDVLFIGPQNAPGHSYVKGFELSYQQTFDFLPGLLSGLGVQSNYTFVDPSSVPNSLGGIAASPTTSVNIGALPLAGLSKHTINGEIFYERGALSMRAAYNWRSKYLLTVRDEIVPNLPIYSASYGQLDGSMIYSVNNHFKIGVQGVNLLNSVTKTLSVIDANGLLAPRSYFVNDRRFTLTTRMKF
ncbi:TonB-dependent receptor [Sphingomonas sp. UYP23]